MRSFAALCVLIFLVSLAIVSKAGERSTGSITFAPTASEAEVPERFRLTAHEFPFTQTPQKTYSKSFEIFEVTFPSPVETPHAQNNTVHCEYFRPLGDANRPGVIVLHILGGDFDLARLFCRGLASEGISALFLKMPYYGPRRPPGSSARMVSIDPHETVRGMTQAILDIRRGTAWLGSRPEVNPDQLGVMGISLGGITSALAVSIEPRLQNACLLLAGGDIGQVAWQSPELRKLREKWVAQGGNQETLREAIAVIDPVTYAPRARGKRILMLNARQDEVIPPACTESLWKALGEPEIVWWDAGHYTAIRYIFTGLSRSVAFFKASATQPAAAGS
jgi:dienelactone hydrolase